MRVPLLALAALAAAFPAAAAGAIAPPAVVAGPDAAITELGGVALAGDGTGGLVYRKVDGTGSHIWVSRFVNGTWTPAARIDVSLPYDSYVPRIAAGDGGRLLVVWAQDYGHKGRIPQFRLQSATIAPGGRQFQTPLSVAPQVSGDGGVDGANASDPDLVMNDQGVAYVAYRQRLTTQTNGKRPGRGGDTSSVFRVARFAGGVWSNAGTVNRNSTSSVPQAAPGNGPEVTADLNGNGLVAWIEPDDAGVERVWGRRLFATRQGLPQQLSPATIDGKALRGDADAFSLDGGGLGSGAVVFRQQPGASSPLDGPRMMVSRITAPPNPTATTWDDAVAVTSDGDALSPPAVAGDDHEDVALAYGTGATVRAGLVTKPVSGTLPTATTTANGAPAIAVGSGGALVSAWPVLDGGSAGVAVQQVLPGGKQLAAQLSGVRGGPVSDLKVAGSGLGDALVAFLQGSGQDTQVVGAAVRVPPQPFVVTGPDDWTKPTQVRLLWDRPASATGPVRYSVLVDGHTVGSGLLAPFARLPKGGLDDGEHDVVVRATDTTGQATDSDPVTVLVDGHAPTVRARIDRARNLTLTLADDAQGKGSGVDRGATRITYGDGTTGKGKKGLRHRFARPGRYLVVVHAVDEAGNTRTARFSVKA